MIPPSSSAESGKSPESGKREKEKASAAVPVSSRPFPLVIFTPPSLQKGDFQVCFFPNHHQMVAYTQKCSMENPMGYTAVANLSVLVSRNFSFPLNTAEATQNFWVHYKYIFRSTANREIHVNSSD